MPKHIGLGSRQAAQGSPAELLHVFGIVAQSGHVLAAQ